MFINGKKITLRIWKSGQGYVSPDLLPELDSHDDGCEVSQEEYLRIVDFWKEEVHDFNTTGNSEILGLDTVDADAEYILEYE